jgi:hypothetical protein
LTASIAFQRLFKARGGSKYPTMAVLKLNNLTRISVQKLIKEDGWTGRLGNWRISIEPRMKPDESTFLVVILDDQPKLTFQVAEQVIKGRLSHGGFISWDKNTIYYAVSNLDGKRGRHLYLGFIGGDIHVGIRTDFKATYQSACLSRNQRAKLQRWKETYGNCGRKKLDITKTFYEHLEEERQKKQP